MVSQEDHQQNCRIGQCLTRAFPRLFGLLYFVSANLFTFTLSVQLPDGHFAMNTSDQESFALNEIRSSHQSGDGITSEIEQPTLPPADGGRAAWLMLASCCLIQLPVWGMLCIQRVQIDHHSLRYHRFLFRLWNFPGILLHSRCPQGQQG